MTTLTPREFTCLKWAAAGKTSYETALILRISQRTVDYHIFNACTKLGVHNRRAAVAVAMQMKLLPNVQRLLPRPKPAVRRAIIVSEARPLPKPGASRSPGWRRKIRGCRLCRLY